MRIFEISHLFPTGHRQLFWVFPSPAWESPSISSRTGLWASASQNFFFSLAEHHFPLLLRLVWLSPLFDYQSMNEWLISNEKFGDVSGLVQGRLIFICISWLTNRIPHQGDRIRTYGPLYPKQMRWPDCATPRLPPGTTRSTQRTTNFHFLGKTAQKWIRTTDTRIFSPLL